jgi:RNA polymerase sigma factor (sigma-70 family)
MKGSEYEREKANKAFGKFYEAVQEDLIAICLKICYRSKLTSNYESAEDIAQETLITCYLKIGDFREENYNNVKTLKIGIMLWLRTIALRKWLDAIEVFNRENTPKMDAIKNYYRGLKKVGRNSPNSDTATIFLKTGSVKGYKKIDSVKFSELVHNLREREHDVLLTYMNYYPEQPERSVLNDLAKKYGVDKKYLRIIKRRALNKIRMSLRAIS